MTSQPIEPMGDAAQWVSVRADGGSPSPEIAIADDTDVVGFGADGASGRITATAAAAGHALRRTFAPVDVSGFTELRLSVRADRRAGAGGAGFFLELRLASAAMPLSDPANAWHRLLPVRTPHTWETVRLGLDDLDPAVAGALDTLQLRCVDGTAPFTAHLDDVAAVRPRVIADADRALEARLAGIVAAGAPAAAAVRAPAEAPPAAPALDIVQVAVRYAPRRARDVQVLQDFTTEGARLVPLGAPYDLDYTLTPVASTRAEQTALIEAVLDRLEPLDELVVDGERLPVELVWVTGVDQVGGAFTGVPVLYYRVGVRRAATASQAVREVRELRVDADQREAG